MALIGRIPNNQFAGQSTITSVVFGSKCNFVGQNAFRDCISLSKINDDNMIENIQPYAFANCSNLLSVNFNELSINLCSNAFYGCNNLESVNMPQCINIPTNAFANCYNLMYINIPNVTEIGVSAFSSCYNLMSVNIENNFYIIYPYAFYGCSNLKDINLNKCLSIGERAFDCCSSLNTINLSMCNFIGSYAFNECINISQVTLSSCDSIYEGAFTNCYNLNKVYINNPESRFCYLDSSHVFCIHDKSTPSLCSINSGITFYFRADVIDKYKKDRYWNYYKDYMMSLLQNNQILYTTDDKEPINIDEYNNKPTTTNTAVNKNLTNYIIMEFKNKVDNLNYGIFKDSSTLTSIDLPLGCQSIGANEFENCIKLEEFKPSDTLKNIGNYAFKNCKSLSSFTIPESVDTLGEGIFAGCENIDTFKGKENFIKYNGKSLVYNNTLICVLPKDNSDTEGRFYKILDIDADIVRLGESCFYGCKNMRRVDIPSSVEEIGSGAFEKCTNLYEIHFEGDEPPTIGNGVFNNIHKDFKIFVPESSLSKYNEKWQELKKHIYPKAENDCIIYYGDKLDLTDNTNEIPYDHESKIDESSINGTYHKLSFIQPIKDIPNYFTNTPIEKIIIGDNITRIGESTFKNCKNLNYIYLSDMISEFGTECFCNCENLTRIHIPRKLFDDKESNIGDDIFCGCSKLKEFGSYVKGVVSDDNRCLMIANSLKFFAQGDMEASYTIPDNIIDINKSAFRDSKITSIKLSQSTKTIGEHAFYGCTNLESIENWNGVESIKAYAFMNCNNLGEISLPTNLKTIEAHSFDNCESMYLNENIPDSIETIGDYAFNGCYNFKCINNDSTGLNLGNITNINNSTFCGCHSLKKVNINDNIESIEENAFEGCSLLTNVIVSNKSNLTSIQANAFKNCGSLVELYLPASLSYIGSYAFENCTSYKGGDYQTYKDPETSEIKQKYYLSIPESLTSIEEYCFSESGIEEIRIQSTDSKLQSISRYSFYKCSNLTSVNISSASELTDIGSCAFKNCNISNLSLSNNIKYIEDEAFSNCNISYITLPEKLSSLGNECFYTYAETLTVYIPSSLKTPPVFKLNRNVNIASNPFGVPNNVTGLTIYSTDFNLINEYKSDVFWEKYKEFIELKFAGIQMNIILDDAYLDRYFLNTKYKISKIGNVRWDDTICLYNSIWEKFKLDEYPIFKDSDKPTNISFFMNNSNVIQFLNDGVQYYSTLNISIPMVCSDDGITKFRIIVSIPNFGRLLQNGLIDDIYEYRPTTVMLSMNTHTDSGKDDDNITTLNSDKQDFGETITYLMPWDEHYNEYDKYKMPVPSKISRKIYPSIMYIPPSGASKIHNISIKLNNEWTSIGDGNEIYNNSDPFSILSWAKYSSEPFKDILDSMGMSSNKGVNINITLIE